MVLYPNLNKNKANQFQDIVLDYLSAAVQGVQIQFLSELKETFLKLNPEIYKLLNERLEEIGIQTTQVSSLDDYKFLLPRFGNNNRFPLDGIYNRNDWEMLACAYKCKVETYLAVMLQLGYDFQVPEYCDEVAENEGDKDGKDWDD
jgi:hypothetical protein